MRPTALIEAKNRRWFPRYRPVHDVYLDLAGEHLDNRSPVLHLGAGRDSLGIARQLPRARIVSLDVDAVGLSQNHGRDRVRADATAMPFHAGTFRVVLCENVFEHLEAPETVLLECHRVLAPGGAVVFLCPNRFSYLGLASSATPRWVHQWFKRTSLGVDEASVFATYYRLNSARRIRALARRTGFAVERLSSHVGWPTYWEFWDLAHRIGVVVHWVIERGPAFFHVTLVGVLRKESA